MNTEQQQQPTTENKPATVFNFDKSFQEKIVHGMLWDKQWCAQFLEVLDVNFFEFEYLRFISRHYSLYYRKYKVFPSLELLISIIKTELAKGSSSDAVLKTHVIEFFKRVATNQNVEDLKYVQEKALDFCKRKALQAALEQSVDLIVSDKYEKVVDIVKKAIAAGTVSSSGMRLVDDVDARYDSAQRDCIPTGIPELDDRKILNGGLSARELGIIVAPTGCHSKGTKLVMFDGSLKPVEKIQVGELLMGPDGGSRHVLSLVRGKDKMMRIMPVKGKSFVVNENHILSLRHTTTGKIENISVKDYQKKNNTYKHEWKLYRSNKISDFGTGKEKKLSIPPYYLGLMLGDGSLTEGRIEITTADKEVEKEIKGCAKFFGLGLSKHPKKNNKASGWYFTTGGSHYNVLREELKDLSLLGTKSGNKFIPEQYKRGCAKDRLEMLAGLLDTDGSLHNNCFDYLTKSQQLAEDVLFIVRSLGFGAYSSKKIVDGKEFVRISISGNTDEIPTKIKRKHAIKRKQKKNVLNTGFKIERLGKGQYFGFTTNKDHLYLMDDFTVLHNCGKSHVLIHIGANALKLGKNVLHYTMELRDGLVGIRYDSHLVDIDSLDCYDNKDRIKEFYQENKHTLGRLMIKEYPSSTITCNTLRAHVDKLSAEGFKPDVIIIDYLGIMRSSDKYDLPRLERARICEELRGFASEIGVPVWSAVQSNKEGDKAEIVDLGNMAESYAQASIADFVLGLHRKSTEKSTGFGNIFIAKNRAGIDGIQLYVHLDTARSKLRVLTEAETKELTELQKSEDSGSYSMPSRQTDMGAAKMLMLTHLRKKLASHNMKVVNMGSKNS